MLAVNNLSINFGERYLFDDLSFTINPHDRIGLVGSNGAGKSTLLKIIAGLSQPMEGSVNKARFVTVGYLPQDAIVESDLSLYKEVESAFEDILLIEEELNEAYQRLGEVDHTTEEYSELLEIIGELQHKQEDADAFRLKSKIETVLMGLGFSVPDLDRSVMEFSGGWQMRIALAKLLLLEPSVLLLDEPTNHLDIESLQWLEDYLKNYNGAIILVSHDRAFLDTLSKKTYALSLGKMEIYSGNYSYYEKEKVIRKELMMNAKKNQDQQLKQTQEFIERFRYKATKARQVRSRIKQMDKIDLIEIEDEEEEIYFHFPVAQQSGRVVMELKDIRKAYGENMVYDHLNYTIERGDRVAIVGVNGAGKSTISKIAAGTEIFQSGERKEGHNVIASYFAQHQAEELDMNKEVLQTVDEVAVGEIRTKLRSILGSFLFRGDDVFKKVKVLSGGEKSRLALAKMLLAPANFLIMDEPTNHLDMRSKKVLQEALHEFDGTYLIVSHDRAFLDSIVNKVLEISPGGRIRMYPGNVSEYIDTKKREKALNQRSENQNTENRVQQQSQKNDAGKTTDKQKMQPDGKSGISDKKNEKPKKNLFQLKKRLEQVEKEIAKKEEEKSFIEKKMASDEFVKYPVKAKTISTEYESVTKKLSQLLEEWTKVSEEIES